FPTTAASLQPLFGGSYESLSLARDGFITKITPDIPVISAVSISGKHLLIEGNGFDRGAVLLMNGQPQKTKRDDSTFATELVGKKTAKKIDPGQAVVLRVQNS